MKNLPSFAASLCALALAPLASAQVLMIDFGPTAAAGAYRTASPYHSVASVSPGSS